MHEVVSFLKDAVKRGAGAMGTQDCYISSGDSLRAANDVMHAGLDWESGVGFAVPADAVDAFLARAKTIDNITLNENDIVLRSGRLRSRIRLRHDEPVPKPSFPDEWIPVPDGFIEALKVAQGFIDPAATGSRLWQSAIRVWAGRVTACNGRILVDITVDGMFMEKPKLLGKPAVNFLISQGKPDEFGVDNSTVTFRWDDGRWVRCQTVNTEMLEGNLAAIFDKVGTDAPVAIDDEWRNVFADAAALSDNTVGLMSDGFRAIRENIASDIALDTGLASGHESWWAAKDLAVILAVASAWNPGSYPNPSYFMAPMTRGVIVGVAK